MLILLGIALFGGTIGGRIFQVLRIPQVVGYIAIGIFVGGMGIQMITPSVLEELIHINYFALGLIGFMIGGELRAEIFRKYGKQFLIMVFTEGLGAFVCVAPLTGLVVWFFTHDMRLAIILGLVIGAISSATDPASTMQVFWEYKTKGVLTTAVTAIVALDDALALTLYAIATSAASFLGRGDDITFAEGFIHLGYELFGALLVGLFCGLILKAMFNFLKDPDRILPFAIGLILFVIGLAQVFKLDIILAAMAFGVVVANLIPKGSHETFDLVKRFATPIYVLFFVFVGAQLNVRHITGLIAILIATYVIGRSVGKMAGVYFGARLSGAPQKVRKYAGLCLFTQAGVAVGLSIMAGQRFTKEISDIIITVIAATTFIVQIIGPAFVKVAVKKAEEIGLNISEADLIDASQVQDFMDHNPPCIAESIKLPEILTIFKNTPNLYYPVVDDKHHILGIITVENIKDTFMESHLNEILLAHDIMEPVPTTVTKTTSLRDVKNIMQRKFLDYIPVVAEENILIGFIEAKLLDKLISTRMIELQEKAALV
jgi:Kef-type K+ transport system membrane component KefB